MTTALKWKDGNPVIVENLEAVKLWIATALKTYRYRHTIYSGQFGSELDALVGRGYSTDIQASEAPRMVEEALLQNPYITAVSDITVDFSNDDVSVSATGASGGTVEIVLETWQTLLTDYLQSLAFADEPLVYSRALYMLLSIDGVTDYAAMTINDGTANIAFDENQVPVLGDVEVTE